MNNQEQFEKQYLLIKQEIQKFDVISAGTIQKHYPMSYPLANVVIQRLLAEDIIEPLPDVYDYAVIK